MRWAIVAMAATLAACTSAPPPPEGVQTIAMHASAEPGSEATYCKRVALDREGDSYLTRFDHAFDGSSHHFFVYESNVTAVDDAPFRCDDAHDLGKTALLYASQKQHDTLAFPDGVAYEVAADRTLLLEWHVVNPSEREVQADAELDVAWSSDPPDALAGMLVYYHPFIHVPAHGSATASMRCMIQEEITLMWTSSHMHERGVGHTAALDRSDGTQTALAATDAWDEAAVTWLDDTRASRGDFISYGCDYDNPTSSAIVEGPAASGNEMCMFFAGYYPRMATEGAEACSGAESGPVFSGSTTCAETLACLSAANTSVATERCWAQTRRESTKPLLDVAYRCAVSKCGDVCDLTDYDAACMTCLENRCAEPLGVCQSDSAD